VTGRRKSPARGGNRTYLGPRRRAARDRGEGVGGWDKKVTAVLTGDVPGSLEGSTEPVRRPFTRAEHVRHRLETARTGGRCTRLQQIGQGCRRHAGREAHQLGRAPEGHRVLRHGTRRPPLMGGAQGLGDALLTTRALHPAGRPEPGTGHLHIRLGPRHDGFGHRASVAVLLMDSKTYQDVKETRDPDTQYVQLPVPPPLISNYVTVRTP
jgi:hypothetical protein